jgi:hypothetical protein
MVAYSFSSGEALGIVSFHRGGTHTVTEAGCGSFRDIRFGPRPVALVVTDILTVCAGGGKAALRLDIGKATLEFIDQQAFVPQSDGRHYWTRGS